jgi:peptidoglycan hydrolase CwlO-like protein
MSDLKKLLAAKKMSGDMQELLTRLKGALETIQEECNRQDERITELEKSHELRINELMLKIEKLEKTVESLNRSVRALSGGAADVYT